MVVMVVIDPKSESPPIRVTPPIRIPPPRIIIGVGIRLVIVFRP
jgi:hypothetical protein